MPRRRPQISTPVGKRDPRFYGIGTRTPVSPAAYLNPVASDAVDKVYDLLSVSAIIGGANTYICTECVDEVYDLLTVVYP